MGKKDELEIKFGASFKEYPPRNKPASFSVADICGR